MRVVAAAQDRPRQEFVVHASACLCLPHSSGLGQRSKSMEPETENPVTEVALAPFGVYLHVPYCRTICPYCDFVKRRIGGAVPDEFIDAVSREIAEFDGPGRADTVFFGGGTPSLVSPPNLERILDALGRRFALPDPEITVEANPDDITDELAAAWKSLGVNRVSLGVQSFSDETLRYLGRRHDAEKARRACETVATHFGNWSMDLIFGAHPAAAFESTLGECAAFAPRHVSAYGLTYEPGTPFGKRADEAIDEDAYLASFWQAAQRLPDLARYEISNFAQPGYECRHNLLYWHNHEYAGFGPAAYSFVNGVRARNVVDTDAYLGNPGEKCEALNLGIDEIRVETVIQHLRLARGLDKSAYAIRFDRDVRDDFGAALDDLLDRGLVVEDNTHIRPTAKGFELNNEIGLALVGG